MSAPDGKAKYINYSQWIVDPFESGHHRYIFIVTPGQCVTLLAYRYIHTKLKLFNNRTETAAKK